MRRTSYKVQPTPCALRLAPCGTPPTRFQPTPCALRLAAHLLQGSSQLLAPCALRLAPCVLRFAASLLPGPNSCFLKPIAPCALRLALCSKPRHQGSNLLFFKPVAPCALRSAASLPPEFEPTCFCRCAIAPLRLWLYGLHPAHKNPLRPMVGHYNWCINATTSAWLQYSQLGLYGVTTPCSLPIAFV